MLIGYARVSTDDQNLVSIAIKATSGQNVACIWRITGESKLHHERGTLTISELRMARWYTSPAPIAIFWREQRDMYNCRADGNSENRKREAISLVDCTGL